MAQLSWQNWDPATWQDVWIYRRHFSVPHEFKGLRLFLEFDGVTVGATPFVNGHALPQHLGGYLGEVLALSRSFSSDPLSDRLWLRADDARLLDDGSDSTRVVFRVVDKFGAQRPFATDEVTLRVAGPGAIIGDNPFSLTDSGGVGAVWIRTLKGRRGQIRLTAEHNTLGKQSVLLEAV